MGSLSVPGKKLLNLFFLFKHHQLFFIAIVNNLQNKTFSLNFSILIFAKSFPSSCGTGVLRERPLKIGEHSLKSVFYMRLPTSNLAHLWSASVTYSLVCGSKFWNCHTLIEIPSLVWLPLWNNLIKLCDMNAQSRPPLPFLLSAFISSFWWLFKWTSEDSALRLSQKLR